MVLPSKFQSDLLPASCSHLIWHIVASHLGHAQKAYDLFDQVLNHLFLFIENLFISIMHESLDASAVCS